jgi:undecaprenyl diphosphate synthase
VPKPEHSTVPQHVAIIMDGNGRWAQQRHMPRTVGHAKGAAGVRALVEYSAKLGIKCLTLFAFSTENWRRPQEEVSYLLRLFMQYLEAEMQDLSAAGVRLRVIGDVNVFASDLRKRIKAVEVATAGNQLITLCVAINYGGRWDVLQAVKGWLIANNGTVHAEISECELETHLSTAGLPEVDLIIRTGGEQRISNFLLWQSAYAELYFTDTLWPDFTKEELIKSIDWFAKRTRRFGMTTEQVV